MFTRLLGSIRQLKLRAKLVASVVLAVAIFPAISVGAYNDFMVARWNPAQSAAYGTYIITDQASNGGADYTAAWIGFDLAPSIPGVTFSGLFTQVGVQSDFDSYYWFVYAESGVTCVRGTQRDARTCIGVIGDIVGQDKVNAYALYQFAGAWVAQVSDYTSGGIYPVAWINSNSHQIYNYIDTNAERVSDFTNSAKLPMRYFFYHPTYLATPSNTYTDLIGPGMFYTATREPMGVICPPYGGLSDLGGDPRYWFAGTNGPMCTFTIP